MLTSALQNPSYQTVVCREICRTLYSCSQSVSISLRTLFALEDNRKNDALSFDSTTLLDIKDVKNCLNGDRDAYKRVVERHQKHISSMMWKFSRDRTVHEELVQDVFVEVYMSLHTFKHKAPFSHWLCRIATRVGYHYWRKIARAGNINTISLEDWDQASSIATENIAPDEAGKLLHRMLGELPPRDRLVLTVRYLEQKSIEQTAELVGWSVSMVKVQTWRAKNKLKKLLEQLPNEAQ